MDITRQEIMHHDEVGKLTGSVFAEESVAAKLQLAFGEALCLGGTLSASDILNILGSTTKGENIGSTRT